MAFKSNFVALWEIHDFSEGPRDLSRRRNIEIMWGNLVILVDERVSQHLGGTTADSFGRKESRGGTARTWSNTI